MRIVEPRIGELIRIGPDITVAVLEVSERRVTLALYFPAGVKITECDVPDGAAEPHFDFLIPS